MNLLNSKEDIQKYITVSAQFDFARALPWIKKAERKYIVPLISKEEYQYFITNLEDTSEAKKIVRELLEEACINLAFHLGFASLFVHITNNGISKPNLENTKQSDWAEKRDLHRSFIRDGNQALDETLLQMEIYLDEFSHWRNSDSFTVLNEHFNRHTDDFQKWYNIHNSRQTFLALRPTIREIHEQYFLPLLGEDTITYIKTRTTNTIVSRALELCKKAEVAFTIATIAITGTYEVTETGFFLRWETLPNEKAKEIDIRKANSLSKKKQIAAEEYLKALKKLIEDNPSLFPNYILKPTTSKTNIIKKKSGLAI